MKFHIENLGRIKKAEIDLRPFTVFIGANNTNKTWMTYIIYAIFDEETIAAFSEYIYKKNSFKQYISESFFDDFFIKGETSFDLQEVIIAKGEQLLNDIADFFTKHWIYDFFALGKEGFEHLQISITDLSSDLPLIQKKLEDIELRNVSSKHPFKIRKDKNIIQFVKQQSTFSEGWIKIHLLVNFISTISLFIKTVFQFPAERKTLNTLYQRLSVNSFDKIFNSLKKYIKDNDQLGSATIEILENLQQYKYPRPITSFIDFLNRVENRKGLTYNVRSSESSAYKEAAYWLEQEILAGYIKIEEQDNAKRMQYMAQHSKGIPLYITSSMVKSLSTLSLYLRNYARGNDLLIIDEPEMNLHPEAISKLTELLSVLVNGFEFGLLISTHSPYIIDHLINLMEAAKLSEEQQKEATELFYMKNTNIFINSEKVSVYLFEEEKDGSVTVRQVLDRTTNTIDWGTFSDVSEKIANIYYQLPNN